MDSDLKFATGCGCAYLVVWVLLALLSVALSVGLVLAVIHFLMVH